MQRTERISPANEPESQHALLKVEEDGTAVVSRNDLLHGGLEPRARFDHLLHLMVEMRASDMHLATPDPPVFRIDGVLRCREDLPRMSPQFINKALEAVATEAQRESFHRELELDVAYSIPGLSRFRINAFFQRGTIALAVRRIPLKPPTVEELGLPSVCRTLVVKRNGLVLVTGPSRVGKSSTVAAMIDHLNRTEDRHVITIEDPIEFLYQNDRCAIVQRELGEDTRSFNTALRQALRQDPDVIVVGEMRDLETISTALTAAETGHLVISTVHTISAPQTIERIVDIFPPLHQQQARYQLSLVIEGVLSQLLLPRTQGGSVPAFEIMLGTQAVRNLIREGRIDLISSHLQMGRQHGMQTMEQAIEDLVRSGVVGGEVPGSGVIDGNPRGCPSA